MRKLFKKTLLAVNILFAGLLALSYLAAHVSPEDFILPAFFGLMYPYLLIINGIIALIWTVNLKLEALISVVVILAGMNHMKSYFRPSKTGGNTEAAFTLMSYNVRLFNLYEGPGSISSEKDITGLVSEMAPDILCLQEFYTDGKRTGVEAGFSDAMGKDSHSHIKMMGLGVNGYYGIATFSRFPILNKGEIIHPNSSSLTIYSDLLIGIDTIRIFNNHLQSFRLNSIERSFLNDILGKPDRRYSRLKEVSFSLRDGFVKRAAQARVLKAFIDSSPYPVIVTGDFNDTPVSYSYRKIRKGLSDSFVKTGYGAGFTYKGNYPSNRIDYVLHDNRFRSVFFKVMRVKFSDHYPVMTGFTSIN